MSEGDKKRSRNEYEEEIESVEEKKKEKKHKDKKKHRKEESEAVEEVAVIEEVAEEVEENPEKKHKKKKKDKKESRDKEENAVDEVVSSSSSTESNLYKEHSSTKAMTTSEVAALRSELTIQVIPAEEGDAYKPMTSFACLNPSLDNVCPYVQQYIQEKKFSKPTPIQSQCWGPLLAGRDVIGIAATGSGKTLTFLIPAMLKLAKLRAINGHAKSKGGLPKPKVLIIAPTRELAMQSHQVVEEIKGGPKGVCIYGGVPKAQQRADLSAGAEIVVATPGRLLDLIEQQALSLSEICYLVLDEADRMLDDGFEPVIRSILAMCPTAGSGRLQDRQTVMFSATWPEEIRALADKFLKRDVVRVVVGSDELSANHRVTQIVECVEAHEKDRKLLGLLEKYHKSRKNRVLVFVLYKKEAADLQNRLLAKGYNVQAIHGDKSQHDRTAALEEFKSGKTPLLIATDVAARGLDIPQVEYVLNYSFPLTVEDYVHRIGRTGRGGATGVSHTFFTDFDKGLAGALVAVLQEAKQEIPQDIYKYQMVTKKKTSKLYGDFGPKAELQGMKSTKITFD